MSSTPTTPKRPRSPTGSNHGDEEVPSSAIGYFLSSVKKSVTKRMRIGYDYLGGGTTNGQTEGDNNGSDGGAAASASGVAGGATPHAHRAALPRKEFGASPVLGSTPAPAAGPGGFGSPPFASPPGVAPFASGVSGQKPRSSGSGSGSKVTRFADGKKTTGAGGSEGKFCRQGWCIWFRCPL